MSTTYMIASGTDRAGNREIIRFTDEEDRKVFIVVPATAAADVLEAIQRAYLDGREDRAGTSETVTSYVIEASVPGKPWITWAHVKDEAGARVAYASFLGSRRNRTRFRLVKHTAVITSEVLESENQEARA